MTDASTLDSNLVRIRAIEADISAGKFREAVAALDALNIATPSDVRVHLAGAMLARATGNPGREILSLQRAVALASRWPLVHIELAKALSRNGQHEEAVATANNAVELAPQDMMALEVAVAIAKEAGDHLTEQRHLRTALGLRPNDAKISKALAMCLAKKRQFGEAEVLLRSVLAQNPDDLFALGWLGTCLIGLDRKNEACTVLQHAIALSPNDPSLPFYFAIARGETPRTQPKELTQQLFDGYASRFDKHLVGGLKYRVPKRVADMIRDRSPGCEVSVLDLGCGTGLLGVYLGRIAGAFVGVDISPKMIEQAARHEVYTELRQGDLLDELRQVSPASFDYVTANDVFIYVGDLSEVIPAAFKALRSGGVLIFSCETADEEEAALVLRPSNRYAHSRGSVEMLCRSAGFSTCIIESIELRFEQNVSIGGFIVVAEKR